MKFHWFKKNGHFLELKIKRNYFHGEWKKSFTGNDGIFIYAALKHLLTAENLNKMKIYKTLEELGEETNEVRKNNPARKYLSQP